MSLWSRAGPCARGHAALCPPGARFEGSISPALLPLSPPCMCQACSPLGTLTHSGAWTHSVHRQWSPHTLGPCSPALKAHTPSHSHSCIHNFHRTHALPAHAHTHTHTHTHLCTQPTPILPCPHTHSMHPHAHTPPSYLSVHTSGADRPSHATNRFTPTFRYSPGHSSRPPPAPGPWSSSGTLLSCTRARSCTHEHLVHMPTHAHVCEHLSLAHLCTRVPTPASALFHSCVHTPIHTPALHTLVHRHQIITQKIPKAAPDEALLCWGHKPAAP